MSATKGDMSTRASASHSIVKAHRAVSVDQEAHLSNYAETEEIGLDEGHDVADAKDFSRIWQKIEEHIEKLIHAGKFPRERIAELKNILLKYKEGFGDEQSQKGLSSLAPIQVRLKPNAVPVVTSPREMGPIEMEAMRLKISANSSGWKN